MKFRYSRHAVEKMVERNIAWGTIEALVIKGQERYRDEVRGNLVAVKRWEGRPLIVAYRHEGDVVAVVTVYSPSNVDKLVERRVLSGRWRPWRR